MTERKDAYAFFLFFTGIFMLQDLIYSEEDQMTYYLKDREAVIKSYEGDAMHVVIPGLLGGMPVTGIEPYAFSAKQMKYVTFPDSLKRIDHHGFSECRSIRKLDFPESVTWIGNYAFYNCWGLESVHLTAYIRSIGYGAFKNCEKLSEITQDKVEGCDISIGSLLDDLDQRIHVTMNHLYPDEPGRAPEPAMVIFPEHDYEIVANVASMCKQFESTEIGSGKYMRYCIGIHDVDYLKYDSMFYVLLRGDPFDTVITVAVERLMYPYGLTIEAGNVYRQYLREHADEAAEKFIHEDKFDKLKFLVHEAAFDREMTDRALDIAAAENRPEYTAFLMDYRHRHFSMADEEFDL